MHPEHRVVVQINIYPMDYRHIQHLLAHHIRVWGPMVERIVVTLDVHRSASGRYRGANFEDYLVKLRALLAEFQREHPQLTTVEVDYSEQARREVAQAFFGREDIPVKAWDGGPFYAYFFGLLHARARYVVHFDGDMLFGGGSRTWVEDAIEVLESDHDVVLVNPLPGPPRADGKVLGQDDAAGFAPIDLPGMGPAFRFHNVSTRIFMIDLQRLRERLGTLPLLAPGLGSRIKSHILGNPPDAREAEVILSMVFEQHRLWRIDMLGRAPGMWSLHPPYRGDEFYRRLPELVAAVESGNVPDAQRGHYDMNDSMIDWSVQRAATRKHKRYLRFLKDRLRIGG